MAPAQSDSHALLDDQSNPLTCPAERQTADECGLYALRNVLRPYRDALLPTRSKLIDAARILEGGESELLKEDECSIFGYTLCSYSCCCKPLERQVSLERADEDGNFGVEVLMRAVAQQQIGGSPVVMEYWGGRHREVSRERELGFILGDGEHWWCIRRCGRGREQWEEIDSLQSQPRQRVWTSREQLIDALSKTKITVLVLYPESEEFQFPSEYPSDILSEFSSGDGSDLNQDIGARHSACCCQ